MPFPLTPSQERTLGLESHLSVTANAGSGKTTVLARRFVEIFKKTDAPLNSVVAVTFTEQAAGELRKKIHEVILACEEDPSGDPSLRSRLRDVRNQLPSALIGTIHSFCARILRMYPAEADIDASFSVLQGQDRSRLVTESVAGAFSDLLGGDAGAGDARDFRELARLLSPGRIESFLYSMFTKREQMYRLLRVPACREVMARGNVRAWKEGIARELDGRAGSLDWEGHASRLMEAAPGPAGVRVGELLSVLSAATDPSRRAGLMAEISEIMLTAGGGLKKKFAGQALRVMEGTESALILGAFHRDFGGALGAVASESADSSDDGPHARCVSSVLRVFVRAQEGYDRRKEELGMLDFEDLQTRTLELLQQTEILDRIRSEYRFFLVDEFQDTNALQYAIVKSLLGGFDRGNVFIVGDPKQSIYGFRNAEAEVFAEAAGDIASAGRGDSVPRGGNLVLAESFRPLVEIAAFVNHLFSRLMGEGTGPAEVGYEALVVGRDEPGLSGIIELLLAAGADGGAAGTAGEECSMIARRIRALASPAGGGAYAYGDCAVLLRDRRNLPAIERAFEREGVPYTLSGGVGFFQTQEIYDFLNYIGFLLSTEDDPSLAGILRSPFFGISDAELYEVSLRPGSSLWEKFTDAAADPAAGEAFRRAGRALTTHLSLAERIPVPRLLRRIGRDTGWLGTMAGLSHGPQRRENFLKLLELARERDSSGPVSLWDFREFLEHHTVAEGREAQAATTAGTDAVKVMTIHSAKGLEFRAVFIPFLDRKFSHDSEPYIDPVHGVGFSLPDPSGGKPRRGPITPYLSAVSAEKRIAEEKRIFYVACTRAKNVLVLSGRQTAVGSGARAARSPMEWLTGILPGGTPPGASGIVSLGERDIACLSRLEGKIDRVARKVALEIMVRIGEAGFDAIPVGAAGPARRGSPRTIIAPVPDLSGGETYSATQIRTYLECPAKYYLTYVLGVGSGPGRVRPRAGEGHTADRDDERDLAGLEGVLTHQLLSVVDRYPTPSGLAGLLPDLLLCAAAGGAQRGGGLSDRVMANVTAFLDSDAGKRILAGGGPKTEFGIFTRFDDAILTGILDRVYAGEDGRMEFVDYKTDDIPPGEVGPRAEAYSAQMATYALLVGRLYRQAEVTGRLVFIKAGCREVAFEFDPATIDRFSGGIRHVISGIRKRNFSPMPVPCHGCPYREGTRCLVVPGTT